MRTRFSFAASVLAMLCITGTLRAQYKVSPVPDGGSYQFDGRGVAVDGSGNVYATSVYVDSTGMNGKPFVVELNPGGSVPVPVLGNNSSPYWGTSTCNASGPLNIGLTDLGGVAVDSSGNVYVAQSGNSPIVEITENTFTCPFQNNEYSPGPPNGIAVDKAGNIFIADTTASHMIYMGKPGPLPVPIASMAQACTNGQIGEASGVAVDSAGNLQKTPVRSKPDGRSIGHSQSTNQRAFSTSSARGVRPFWRANEEFPHGSQRSSTREKNGITKVSKRSRTCSSWSP